MNFKDLKIGKKLILGFGILIGITFVLGILAILSMYSVKDKSQDLAESYVPEMLVANNVERSASILRFEMRTYSLNEKEQHYLAAITHLSDLRRYISEAQNLANKYENLTVLRDKVRILSNAVDKYAGYISQTKELTGKLKQNRKTLDEKAKNYMNLCYAYLSTQNNILLSGRGNANIAKRNILVNNLIDLGNQIFINTWKAQNERNPQLIQEALKLFEKIENSVFPEMITLTQDDASLRQIADCKTEAADYKKAMTELLKNFNQLQTINDLRLVAGNEVLKESAAVANTAMNNTSEIANSSNSTLGNAMGILIFGLIVALLLGFWFSTMITRSINEPILKGINFAKKIAEGDLTTNVDVYQKDEIGELAEALRNMVQKLKTVIGTVRMNSENFYTASQEMASNSQQMSQGASEQASSTEEVSSSMQEMSANIQQNTDNAKQTEHIAKKAAQDIIESSKNVNFTAESMKTIAEKISIVNEIAFQTNILALNAAVEAARAGENGKGFAVVASEVRKLAEKSQKAAIEIDQLSRTNVEIAEKSSKMLDSIVPNILKTAQLVQEIASASIEQAAGTEQISNAIQQLNTVTQRNASTSEEMATNSEELAGQAEQLREITTFFKTGQEISHHLKNTSAKKHYFRNTSKGVHLNMDNENSQNNNDFETF